MQKQKSLLTNNLNFVEYNYFLNNFNNNNSFFFKIKFLKFFNFSIRFLSVINKGFLKKKLRFFSKKNSKKKKKQLVAKFLGFKAKIYKINNFDKFNFLKIIFQKKKKPFYIFDSSSFFCVKNAITNNRKFFIKSVLSKFFYSFLNNARLIKNQFFESFFYDFFLRNLLDVKFFFKLIFDLKRSKFNFIHLLKNFIKPFLTINRFIFKKEN